MEQEDRICSKCGKNPAQNGQRWCRQCRTEHEGGRQATQAEILQAKWFQRGAQAMREELRDVFVRHPVASFAGLEIARYIHEAPSPRCLPDRR